MQITFVVKETDAINVRASEQLLIFINIIINKNTTSSSKADQEIHVILKAFFKQIMLQPFSFEKACILWHILYLIIGLGLVFQ